MIFKQNKALVISDFDGTMCTVDLGNKVLSTKYVLFRKCEEERTTPYQPFHDFSAIFQYLKNIF